MHLPCLNSKGLPRHNSPVSAKPQESETPQENMMFGFARPAGRRMVSDHFNPLIAETISALAIVVVAKVSARRDAPGSRLTL
ncbi:MAG: hypothetical protein HOO88_07770 [Kiritimatiellaceae bacterium]|nr:hypothetical protein [Kiritimatiellaceae bacterium]